MTTLAYVHSARPPFPRIGGPIYPSRLIMELGLSINSNATLFVASADLELDWIQPGMCWVIEQPDIGEETWGGFVETQELKMDADVVTIPLLGPKTALLASELALRVPGRVSSGRAVAAALEAAQSRYGGIFAGDIDDVGPAIINIDVRGETISKYIETIQEASSADWRERLEQFGDNTIEFKLDFGLLRHDTNIRLTKEEIIEGIFSRQRLPTSVTEFGAGSGFASREAATIASSIAAGRQAPEPSDGVLHPETAVISELVNQRDIGPAATFHVTEISERVERNVSTLAAERQEVLLRTVDEIFMTLDGTKAPVQALRVGDVVRVDVNNWLLGQDVLTDVHIRQIQPDNARGQRIVTAAVIHRRAVPSDL